MASAGPAGSAAPDLSSFNPCGCVAVVTGGASGIGLALSRLLVEKGARHVVLADISDIAGRAEADNLNSESTKRGGFGNVASYRRCNVDGENPIRSCIDATVAEHGRLDLFVSNAGVLALGGVEVSSGLTDEEWERVWKINTMAHVWAARHLLPHWSKKGSAGGFLVITSSAAGLLTQLGGLPYSVTKHAAVAIAEWLAITYGSHGMHVSVLCPQAVDTPMVAATGASVAGVDGVLSPEVVAQATLDAIARGEFLITPHTSVREYMQRKAGDTDRWIRGMRRLSDKFNPPSSKL